MFNQKFKPPFKKKLTENSFCLCILFRFESFKLISTRVMIDFLVRNSVFVLFLPHRQIMYYGLVSRNSW